MEGKGTFVSYKERKLGCCGCGGRKDRTCLALGGGWESTGGARGPHGAPLGGQAWSQRGCSPSSSWLFAPAPGRNHYASVTVLAIPYCIWGEKGEKGG